MSGGRQATRDAVLVLALGPLAVVAFAGAGILWRLNGLDAAEARRLRLAPPCTEATTTDCWEMVPATVKRVYRRWSYWGTAEDILEVRLATGPSDLIDRGGKLRQRLRPGDRIQAQLWNGKAVRALGADGTAMLTQYDPGWRASDKRIGAIFLVFVGSGLLVTDLWISKRRDARPSARRRR